MVDAEFQVCPIFSNMFSDLPHYPRYQLIRRHHSLKLPVCLRQFTTTHPTIITHHKTRFDVNGVDRYKYFHIPLKSNNLKLETTTKPPPKAINEKPIKLKKCCTKKIQTQYRESSAQTIPWEPSFVITRGTDPELLKIDFLKWGSGLPVGVHESEIIQRARMKRAWRQYLEQHYSNNLQKYSEIISALERDEWAFREKEIQDIQDLRLALLEDMLNEVHQKSVNRADLKTRNFAKMKTNEMNEKLRKLQQKTERELKKIQLKEIGIKQSPSKKKPSTKYQKQMRFCMDKTNWHQIIDDDTKLCPTELSNIEMLDTLPKWLDQATKIKDCCCLKLPGRHLCIRETKWTGPVLKELHQQLEYLRFKKEERPSKLSRIRAPSVESILHTPEVEGIPEWEEQRFQSVITLQSLIKGRAAQFLIYKGRDHCRQLIEELKYSHCLVDEGKEICRITSEDKLQQRKERLEYERLIKLKTNLQELQHNIVGTLLDFLNKKLQLLIEERRIHAVCILFDQQRHEYDELFREEFNIDEQSFDRCLESIITEGMNFETKEEIEEYVKSLLRQIESEVFKITQTDSLTSQDTADLEQASSSESENQFEKLKSIHEMIYE